MSTFVVHIEGYPLRVGRYIQKRGDGYRFRARLPRKFVACFTRGEISVSLATRSRRTAVRRARILRVALETLMPQLASSQMTRTKAEALVRLWIDNARDACERDIAETGTAFFAGEDVARMGDENAQELDALMRFAFERDVARDIANDVRRGLVRGLPEGSDLAPIVADVQAALAPDLAADSIDGRFLARTILRGVATLIDEKLAVVTGAPTPIPTAKDLPQPEPPAKIVPSFMARWEDFSRWKIRENDWTYDSAQNAKATPKLFKGIADPDGLRKASEIDREVVSGFREKLLETPKFYDKDRRLRDLPFLDMIDAADSLDRAAKKAVEGTDKTPAKVPRLKAKTADKHFSNLIEYWNWQALTGTIPKDADCPFTGFLSEKRSYREARSDRNAWTPPKEDILWAAPVWQGCFSIYRRARAGEEIHRDALFWVPIIGRMTGMREDEICSMPVGGVVRVEKIEYPPEQTGPESVWIFRINFSKTPGSTRDVPLPQGLLDLGFPEHRVPRP